MKRVGYKGDDGRWFSVLLPDDEPDENAHLGVPIGPPDVVFPVQLPESFFVRLHNELYFRGVFTSRDAMTRRADVQAAMLAASKASVEMVIQAYMEWENG
jgi:hypothetical protein